MARGVEPPERPDLYVVARFLDALRNDARSHTKSTLQMAVRLNYDRFLRYLAFLENKGWVRVEAKAGPGESPGVHLTAEGLAAYHHLVEWVRNVVGDVLD